MWSENILRLLAMTSLGGVVCGALWDLFSVPRVLLGIPEDPRLKSFSFFVVLVQDIVFCLSCACVTLVALYYGNEGKPRAVAVFWQVACFAAYRLTLGRLALCTAKRMRALSARIKNQVIVRSKRNKIGKHQNCKIIGDKRVREKAFHKSKSRFALGRKKSA